ncbi:lysoplasmalogenase family protein [Anaerocolumna cellulosilytica]|nr:lysoplasmalogenase family protein [Anaerocolumna cellulosilytica]
MKYLHLSVWIKFIGILVCFLFVLSRDSLTTKNHRYVIESKTDSCIMATALAFTVLSDYFILVRNIYIPGLITFIAVQILYLVRLSLWERMDKKENKSIKKLLFLIYPNIILCLLILLLLHMSSIRFEPILVLSTFYFISIIRNTIKAVYAALKKRHKAAVTFAGGMVLFLLCDINVGIFNLSDFVTLPYLIFSKLYEFSVIGMWLFYLPSQVLVALSCEIKKE